MPPTVGANGTASPLVELGSTGLQRQAGFVWEELLRDLSGRRAVLTYREMADNDGTVGAVLFAIDMLMRQVEWRVDPVSTDPADLEAADFVDSCMQDMSATWTDLISEILSMLTFGF